MTIVNTFSRAITTAICCFLILLLQPVDSFSQSEKDILKQAQELVSGKKYNSAFKLLNGFDPENQHPDIVLYKEYIALNFFVKSISHQIFSFRDLESYEEISEAREQDGPSDSYHFPVNDILDSLIRVFPQKYDLYRGLGDYYYEAHLRYGEDWIKNTEQVFDLMEKNYSVAVNHKAGDFKSYYVLGYINTSNQKYEESIPCYRKSIALNDGYAPAWYNMAYSWMNLDERDSAIACAMEAYTLYTEPLFKGDAARLIATMYNEMENDSAAIAWFKLSNAADPNNYNTLKPLLRLEVTNETEDTASTREVFFKLAPENPTIYNDLNEIYLFNERSQALIAYYQKKTEEYKNYPKVLGNLEYYLGQIYMDIDKNISRKYLLNAKQIFSEVYEPDHEVFGLIEDALNELK